MFLVRNSTLVVHGKRGALFWVAITGLEDEATISSPASRNTPRLAYGMFEFPPGCVADAEGQSVSIGARCGEREHAKSFEKFVETTEQDECTGLGEDKGLVDCRWGWQNNTL